MWKRLGKALLGLFSPLAAGSLMRLIAYVLKKQGTKYQTNCLEL
jgi:hypothetical protein